jgi:hypothetical protein
VLDAETVTDSYLLYHRAEVRSSAEWIFGLKWRFGARIWIISAKFYFGKEMYVLDSVWLLEAGFRDYVRRHARGYAREEKRCVQDSRGSSWLESEGRAKFVGDVLNYLLRLILANILACYDMLHRAIGLESDLYCNVKHVICPYAC